MPKNGRVASRVARPRNSSVEKVNSLNVAIRAMSIGSNTGTLYSSRKRRSVTSHDRYLSNPALKNTEPMAIRIRSCSADKGRRASDRSAASIILNGHADWGEIGVFIGDPQVDQWT